MGEDEVFRGMRVDYVSQPLLEQEMDSTPLDQFRRWLDDAVAGGIPEPNAMVVATANREEPSARTVLLKGVDDRGFSFYTNLASRKARDLEAVPRATLVFPWLVQHRQVLVSGPVGLVPADEADAYFASRPRAAQLGAWASQQSETLAARSDLDRALEEAQARWPNDVPRPPHWGGLIVMPTRVEFWQGRTSRLHDRIAYERDAVGVALPTGARIADPAPWSLRRLSP